MKKKKRRVMIPLEGVEPPGQALYRLQSPNMATPTSAALSTPLQEEGAILDKGRARHLPPNPWQWFDEVPSSYDGCQAKPHLSPLMWPSAAHYGIHYFFTKPNWLLVWPLGMPCRPEIEFAVQTSITGPIFCAFSHSLGYLAPCGPLLDGTNS